MGVLDTTVKQLILVKADTSQAKQAIKELSGEEKKAAKERLDDIERQNSKLENSVRSWTKVAAGVAGAVAAYKLMSKAAEAAIEDAKRSGTAGEGAAKAWTDATKKWDAAVNQLMVSFGKLVIELAPLVDLMAELVSQIAHAIDLLNHPRQAASDFISLGQAFGTTANAAFGNQNRSYSRMALDMGSKLSGANPLGLPDDYFTVEHMQKSRGYMDLYGAGISRIQDGWGALAARLQPKKGKRAPGITTEGDIVGDFSQLFQTNMSAGGEVFGALSRTYQDARKGTTLGTEDQTGLARLRALLEQAKRDVAEWNDEVAQMQRERQQSFLESIFGPVGEFNIYAEGFNMLTDAARTAFDAWITGSESIGTAVKRAVAESLRALAGQALVESLKHAAFAIGSLAFFDYRGAAMHGLAAAKFAGVAVAAGVAAHQMGAGQSGSYGGAGAGASGGAGGYLSPSSGGGTPNYTTVVYLPPDWDDRTPGEKAQALARVVKRGSVNRTNNIVMNH